MAEEKAPKALSTNDWSLIAHWIRAEKERRALDRRRVELERIWKEIDRQVAMEPLPRQVQSGQKQDWLPDIELPLQFNTLEVNCADARRLKFPRGSEWYSVSADLSDEYMKRFDQRRARFPMIGRRPVPMKLDQETANTLVKTTVDHFHRQYDFRGKIDLFDVECIKYGTAVLRTKEVVVHKFFNDYRGTKSTTVRGPASVPVSIKNVYLDDTPMAVMHEGITMSPGHIRCTWKRHKDVQNAIATGGPERGWRTAAVRRLEPERSKDDKDQHLELIEFEGDLVVPRNSGRAIFLPHVIVTVAAGRNACEVVRFLENPLPFTSYDVGWYMRDDLSSPYGTSPLIKGQPLQEAATECINELLAAGALAARPPIFYDRNDATLVAKGGPMIHPGAQTPTDSPDAIEFMERPDVAKLLQVYLALVKQYEDLTAVNDPRRGGPVRSHTTATAIDIEQTRGLARTDDFVQGQEQGPITSLLYKHYEIIKAALKSPQPVQVDAGGIEGWVNVAAQDLPDTVAFRVHGSAGVLNERQQAENFAAATNIALQMTAAAAQLGQPLTPDFQRWIMEVFKRGGINNAGQFFPAAGAGAVPAGAAAAPALPTPLAGVPSNDLTDIQAVAGI